MPLFSRRRFPCRRRRACRARFALEFMTADAAQSLPRQFAREFSAMPIIAFRAAVHRDGRRGDTGQAGFLPLGHFAAILYFIKRRLIRFRRCRALTSCSPPPRLSNARPIEFATIASPIIALSYASFAEFHDYFDYFGGSHRYIYLMTRASPLGHGASRSLASRSPVSA